MKKHQFIKENKEIFIKIRNSGVNPRTALIKLEAYIIFIKIIEDNIFRTGKPHKLKAYEITAKKMFGKNGKAKLIRDWVYELKGEL